LLFYRFWWPWWSRKSKRNNIGIKT
jgi:hypothetical protein